MAVNNTEDLKKVQEGVTQLTANVKNKAKSYTEEELKKDPKFLANNKVLYNFFEGKPYDGDDDGIAQWGLEKQSMFNNNITLGTAKITAQLHDAPIEVKSAFLHSMEQYDNKEWSWNGLGRALKDMAIDPASYVGLSTLGVAFAGKEAVKQGAKLGVKQMLKQGIKKALTSTTALATAEGALYGAGGDFARQDVRIGAGEQENLDTTELATSGAIGGAIGGTLGLASKYLGNKLQNVLSKPEQEHALQQIQDIHNEPDTKPPTLEDLSEHFFEPAYTVKQKEIAEKNKKEMFNKHWAKRDDMRSQYISKFSTNTNEVYAIDKRGTTTALKDHEKPEYYKEAVGIKDPYVNDDIVKQAELEALTIRHTKYNEMTNGGNKKINFKNISSSEDVKKTLNVLFDRANSANKKELKVMSDTELKELTNKELDELSDLTGTSNDIVLKMLNNDKETFDLRPERVIAVRKFLEQSALETYRMSERIVSGNATDKEKLHFMKMFKITGQVSQHFLGVRTNVGRLLRSMGSNLDEFSGDGLQEALTQVAYNQDINTVAQRIFATSDAKGTIQAIKNQDTIGSKVTQVATEHFINSILSGATTQITNLVSNALRLGMDSVDTVTASLLGRSVPSSRDRILAGEMQAKLFGMMQGHQEAWHIASNVAKTGEAYGGIDKIEQGFEKAVSSEYLGLSEDSKLGKMVDMYGNFLRFPTERVMGSIDAYFKALAEKGQLHALAFRRANQPNVPERLRKPLLQHLVNNPTEEMLEEARNYGLDMTFQTPLGKSGRMVQQIVNRHPALKLFIPFIKTPTNLMKQAFLERTPIALFSEHYKQQIAKGGATAQMARAKLINGSLLSTVALSLAMNGHITGSEPQDKSMRDAWKLEGKEARSFVFNNTDGTKTYISYDKLEPFSILFSLVADSHDYFVNNIFEEEEDEDNEKHKHKLMSGIVAAFTTNVTDRSFMQGVQQIVQILREPTRFAPTFLSNMLNNLAPYSGLRRELSKLENDGVVKDARSSLDYLKRQTPLFNGDLPPILDVLGNPVHYDHKGLVWFPKTSTKDPIIQEVVKLNYATDSSVLYLPSRNLRGVRLSSKQFHDMVLYSRKELKIGKTNYYSYLKNIINDSDYKKLSDHAKVTLLKKATRKFDDKARKWIIEQNPEIAKQIKEYKLRRK